MNYLFKDRDGQTPLPKELLKGLKPKSVQTVGELDEYEEASIAEGLIWLSDNTPASFDYSFWIKLHKKLFNDVWKWAGKIREHELDNPDFLGPYQIRPALQQLIGDMDFWIEHRSYEERELAARLHVRLLTIHPFANGNGRWSRILTELYCSKMGITIPTWNEEMRDSPRERRAEYINGILEGRHNKNFKPLVELIFN